MSSPVAKPAKRKTALVMLFVLIFGMGFTGLAGVLVADMFGKMLEHRSMRNWAETSARVTQAELIVNHGGRSGHTLYYRATAEYDYEYTGKLYHGSRVGIHPDSDNFGGFQQRVAHELKEHQLRGEPIHCFVNPQNPGQSILYRELRWEMVLFDEVPVLICGGFGIFLLMTALQGLRACWTRARLMRSYPEEPWRWRADWALNRAVSADNFWFPLIMTAAILGNVVLAPLWWLLLPQVMHKNRSAILAMFLPVLGLAAAAWAALFLLRRLKYGRYAFLMERTPGIIGGELVGNIETARPVGTNQFDLVLRCDRTMTTTPSLAKRSSITTQTLWQGEQTITLEPSANPAGGSTIPVQFAIPDGCRSSEDLKNDQTEWRLTAAAKVPGVDFKAEFLVPVFELTGHPVETRA